MFNRLLNSLKCSLQSSGVDLSKTNISVQLDVGKQANGGSTNPVYSIKVLRSLFFSFTSFSVVLLCSFLLSLQYSIKHIHLQKYYSDMNRWVLTKKVLVLMCYFSTFHKESLEEVGTYNYFLRSEWGNLKATCFRCFFFCFFLPLAFLFVFSSLSFTCFMTLS